MISSSKRDIPWHQYQQEDWLDIQLSIILLKLYSLFDYIIDLGCGSYGKEVRINKS